MIKSFNEHNKTEGKYEMKWASSVIWGMGFSSITKYGIIEYQKLFKESGNPDGTEFTDDIDTDPLDDFDERFDKRMEMYFPSDNGVFTKEEIRSIARKSVELGKMCFDKYGHIRGENEFRKEYQKFKKKYKLN